MHLNRLRLVSAMIYFMFIGCNGFSHISMYQHVQNVPSVFGQRSFKGNTRNYPARRASSSLSMVISRDLTPLTDSDSDLAITALDSAVERRLPVTEYFKPLVQGDRLESTVLQQAIVAGSSLLILGMILKTGLLCLQIPDSLNWPLMLVAVFLGYEFADLGYVVVSPPQSVFTRCSNLVN